MSQPSPTQTPPDAVDRKVNGLAALGLAIGAAKRGRHSFVMLSLENAQAIHSVTKVIQRNSYKKDYQKRYRAFKKSCKARLKAKV